PTPRVVPTGRDLQAAHGAFRLPANQAAAFFRISRSSRSPAFSWRGRASSRSFVLSPSVRLPCPDLPARPSSESPGPTVPTHGSSSFVRAIPLGAVQQYFSLMATYNHNIMARTVTAIGPTMAANAGRDSQVIPSNPPLVANAA